MELPEVGDIIIITKAGNGLIEYWVDVWLKVVKIGYNGNNNYRQCYFCNYSDERLRRTLDTYCPINFGFINFQGITWSKWNG
jgi:hypothetical protein